MSEITVPTEGRQTEATSSSDLVGVDGNAFAIMAFTQRTLRRAGATPAFTEAYRAAASSGDYDHLIAVSVAFLDAEPS